MSDGQKQQPCPSGPGMTPLMASHKEAGAMGWLGRDRLNLCEGAGAGEGTAAPAKTARPSALPPGGPEPEVSRAAQPSAPPTEALDGMCACRLSARSVVRGAWVAPPPVRQGSSSGDRAGVPLCAGDPADSSREPQQQLLAAVASQNVSPSPWRHAVWLCVGLRSSFSVREHEGGSAGPLAGPAGSPAPPTKCSRTGAAWHLVLPPVVAGVLATPHRASPGSSSGESWVAPPPARPLHPAGGRTGARTAGAPPRSGRCMAAPHELLLTVQTAAQALRHDSAPDVLILRDGDPVTGDTNGLSSLVEVEAHRQP